MEQTIVVCGLGNPGDRYRRTRHNVGFEVVDHLSRAAGARWSRPDPSYMACHARLSRRAGLLVKPQTYMNLSGDALRAVARVEPFAPGNLLVVCDDIALPAGQLRLRPRGSDGGHNGLRSVIEALGTQTFARLRLGVGAAPEGVDPADYVLDPLDDAQWRDTLAMVRAAVRCVEVWAEEGITVAMNRFNPRPAPEPGEDTG